MQRKCSASHHAESFAGSQQAATSVSTGSDPHSATMVKQSGAVVIVHLYPAAPLRPELGDVIFINGPWALKCDGPKPLLVKPIDPHSHTATPKTKPLAYPLSLSESETKINSLPSLFPSSVSAMWV
ncbi:hypothetical protein EXN66_Car002511 [Channa argus]|uniref:Uncharacterized protein n=1 Tax=Channa argus TaxID=215402 RepID=A0A6G1P9F4_CHAAH|nr:hypothetical protein EXN66_Car002511 [Channa argus]